MNELRLYAAEGAVQAAVAAPVPDKTAGERMFVAAALGEPACGR